MIDSCRHILFTRIRNLDMRFSNRIDKHLRFISRPVHLSDSCSPLHVHRGFYEIGEACVVFEVLFIAEKGTDNFAVIYEQQV